MSREKQIAEIADKLCTTSYFCPTENWDSCSQADGEYCDRCRKLAERLYNAGYRKQSENMVELPCKVGDSVWCIYNYTKPKEFQIAILTMSKNHYSFTIETKDGIYKHYCDKEAVGKWVFFTKEEAEEVLAKMKGG